MTSDDQKKPENLEARKGAGIVNGNPAPGIFIQTDTSALNKQPTESVKEEE